MLAKRVLAGALWVAFLIECLFPIGGFFAPARTLELFAVAATPDTLFLTFVLAWLLLFVAVACGLALWWVRRDVAAGWTLSYALGLWWIGIGLSLFVVHGRVDNLFLDGLKGLILTAAAYRSRPR